MNSFFYLPPERHHSYSPPEHKIEKKAVYPADEREEYEELESL